jgi:hypothetical protein
LLSAEEFDSLCRHLDYVHGAQANG